MTYEVRELISALGERLRKDHALDERLPLPIALMLAHLQRAECERGSAGVEASPCL